MLKIMQKFSKCVFRRTVSHIENNKNHHKTKYIEKRKQKFMDTLLQLNYFTVVLKVYSFLFYHV